MPRVTSVTTPVAHLVGPGKLKVVNGQLAYTTDGQSALRLDPQALQTVLCYGPVGMSDQAVQVLFQHGVEVAWMTSGGTRCRGRMVRSDPPTTGLRLAQHRALEDSGFRLQLAAGVVLAKVESQVTAARHYQRHGCTEVGAVLPQLQEALRQCRQAVNLDQLRGIEGAASAAWFGLLGVLLRPPWQFTVRTRRPPTDPVNALLSLGYTWLTTRTAARCEAAGLEVNLGALHEFRPGRPSLACDLVEPLRVPAVDRWVIAVCNRQQLAPADFRTEEGAVLLQPGVFPRMLRDWEEHWHQSGSVEVMEQTIGRFATAVRQWAALTLPAADGSADLAL